MAPPSFCDLGKDARDLLSKNFYLGVFSVKCTSSIGEHKLLTTISQSFKAKKIASSFESKYKIPEYGATFSKKWSSDSLLDGELTIEDKLYKGLKQTFKLCGEGYNEKWNASIKNNLKTDGATVDLDLFFKSALPDLTPSFVLSHSGYQAGVDLRLDSTSRSVQRANFAVGYAVQDFAFHGLISSWGKRFSASLFQRITDHVEMAGSISWSRETDEVAWSVGTKYTIDKDYGHFIKAKLDHLTRISLSYTTFLTKGLQFSLCGIFNGPEIPQLGLGFELEC
ncbi:unnamed protein product [Calicophoron daubneyi]|uniref:Voltage-dependent anion-selective channel protein 1 n=1 Tax=Calicophoron daubneyi TaxID=300641 RepID=A0AAV2TA66_CALDB